MEQIGDRIKFLRVYNGMSQREFGEMIRLSQDHISLFERKKRIPTENTVDIICMKFLVNKRWLTKGTGEMFRNPLAGDEVSDQVKELGRKLSRLPYKDQLKANKIIETMLE